MTVRTNYASLVSQRNLKTNQAKLDGAVDRVSSGLRINNVSVDSAGFAVSVRISADIGTLAQAQRNAAQGASVAQVATGAMNKVSEILQRMKTLSATVISGALSDTERGYADAEYQKLLEQIDNTATQTLFNGTALVNGGTSTVTTTSANASLDLINEGANGTYFTNIMNNSISQGYIAGLVTSATVTAVGTGGNTFSGTLVVGDQTFTSTFAPPQANNTLAYVTFVSTSNDKNIISLQWNETATHVVPNAATIQADLAGIFGTINGNNAQIRMNHNSSAAVTSLTAPTGGVSGVWAIQGSGDGTTGTVSATDGINTYTATTTTAAAQTITFANGLALNLAAGYTLSTTIAQYTANIVAGSNQTFAFQVGQQSDDTIDLTLYSVRASALGINGTAVNNTTNAAAASLAIDAAITTLNTNMSRVGAVQSQFDYSSTTTAITVENLTAARGVIQDADIGLEMSEFAKFQVLSQMATAMLAQANRIPEQVMRLMS